MVKFVGTKVPTRKKAMPKKNKEHRETFRLTGEELAMLEFVAGFKRGGNKSAYFRHTLSDDFYAMFGNAFYGDVWTPGLVHAMVQLAERKLLVPGPEAKYAAAWLESFFEAVKEISGSPFSEEARVIHNRCMRAYPTSFLIELQEQARAYTDALTSLGEVEDDA